MDLVATGKSVQVFLIGTIHLVTQPSLFFEGKEKHLHLNLCEKCYVVAHNIYSPPSEIRANIRSTETGKIRHQSYRNLSPDPYYASLFDTTLKIEDESKP
jgi:hypothetical protein